MNTRRILWLIALTFGAWIALGVIVISAEWGPQPQEAFNITRIYSFKGWQSTGIHLAKGDAYTIRADGQWMYSPFAGPHGPEGHRYFRAPNFYPLPGVQGGALIGRVGEESKPFYVGKGTSGVADRNGRLYLRIDDDLLGDNEGYVTFEVTVTRLTPTPRK